MTQLRLLIVGISVCGGAFLVRHSTSAAPTILPPGASNAPIRLAQAPTPIFPKFTEPPQANNGSVSYNIPFQIDIKGSTYRFDPRNFIDSPNRELPLTLRSTQIRFAEFDVTVKQGPGKTPVQNVPLRWRASGGKFREAVYLPSDGKNDPISVVKSNSYGYTPAQWVPTKPGLFLIWIEVLRPDSSVFQSSKKIPVLVRAAQWKTKVMTGQWTETRGQTNVYERPVYLFWQLDDPGQLKRIEAVPVAASVALPDGTPVVANVSWFDKQTAPSLGLPAQGQNNTSLQSNLTQFVRYDPTNSPVEDLDEFIVHGKLAAPPSAQLQQTMNAEEASGVQR